MTRRLSGSWILAQTTLVTLLVALPVANAGDAAVRVQTIGTPDAGPPAAIRLTAAAGDVEITARTDATTGVATLSAVPPGAYRLFVEQAGLAAAALDLLVGPDDVVRLTARFDAAPPVIEVRDRHHAAYGSAFDEQSLHDLPGGFDVATLPPTADVLVIGERIDNGGLYVGEPHRLGAHGSSWTQATHRLGELDVTDPERGGTPLLQPGALVAAALEVTSAVSPIEIGPPGAVLGLAPRRPGTAWRGSAVGRFTSDGLQSRNDTPGVPSLGRLESWRSGAIVASGPIRSPRVRVLAAADTTRLERLDRDDATRLEGASDSVLAYLVATPGTDELKVLAAHQRLERPEAGRALYANRDRQETDRLTHVQATWARRTDRGTTGSVTAGWQRGHRSPGGGDPAPGLVERLLDGPVAELVSAGDATRQRWDVALRVAPGLDGFDGGRHAVRLGVEWGRASLTTRAPALAGPVPESVYGLPARVWDYGIPDRASSRARTDLAAFAADRWAVTERFNVEAGARLDFTDGRADGSAEGIRWWRVSPRFSARWRVTDFCRITLFGTYGQYTHRLPLATLAFGDPAALEGTVSRWNDLNRDGRFQPQERGPLLARIGPGGPLVSIDPALRPPWADEVMFGVEARSAGSLVFRFAALRRAESNLIESVNVGVTLDDYGVIDLPDPYIDFVGPSDDRLLRVYDRKPSSFGRDRYRLTNPDDHTSRHEGFEITLSKTAGRFRLLAGATAYRSEGKSGYRGFRVQENDQGVIGELFDDPNAETYSRGRFLFDRNYVIKIAGSWRGPGDLRLGAVARYQDGQPFSRLVIVPGLAQGPEAIQAVPEGRHRFEYNLTLDGRVEKGFALGGRRRLAASVEGFNLLNTDNSVEEDITTRPAFRERPTALRQPPRVLRLGLGFEF